MFPWLGDDIIKTFGLHFLNKLLIFVAVNLFFTAAKLFNDINLSSALILVPIATWNDKIELI